MHVLGRVCCCVTVGDVGMLPVRNLRNICDALLSVHSYVMVNINESMSNVTREGRGDCWLSPDRTTEK